MTVMAIMPARSFLNLVVPLGLAPTAMRYPGIPTASSTAACGPAQSPR
jgi:hypothetical protein